MPESSFKIESRRQGAVAIVVIDNPPVNAMSPGVPGGIIAALERANRDPRGASDRIVGRRARDDCRRRYPLSGKEMARR